MAEPHQDTGTRHGKENPSCRTWIFVDGCEFSATNRFSHVRHEGFFYWEAIMAREYYDKDEVDEDDSGESFFREQLSGHIEQNKVRQKGFDYRKEKDRLLDRKIDIFDMIEQEVWLTNGAIGDPEIAELICGAKLVKSFPFTEIVQMARDYHRAGKRPDEIHEIIMQWPTLDGDYKERFECRLMAPEDKQAFQKYYKRTRNEYALREILEYAERTGYAFDPTKVIEVFAKYSPNEITLPRKVSHMRTPDDVRGWMMRITERDVKRIKTSYMQINLYTGGGLKLGALYGVAAPTGGGKSIVLCWLCADIAARGYRVLFISTEMLEDDIYRRINRCMVDARSDHEASLKMIAKMEDDSFLGYDVWCAEELSSTVAEIEQKARDAKYDVIIVDYGDKLSAGVVTDGEYIRQGIIFSQLSRLAKRLDVPVIVASQQNREALKNPKGGMETIGDSMDKLRPLEMLFSIPYYDLSQMPHMRNKKNLTIQKNRNGIKDVELFFDIDYDAWRMSEPQYVRDCITANPNLGPQEIYLKILDAQKEIKKEAKNAATDDDKND